MSVSSEIARISGEVSNQTDLLEQLRTTLEGKASGGGSGSGAKMVTFTLELDGSVKFTGEYEAGSLSVIDFGGASYKTVETLSITLDDGTFIGGMESKCHYSYFSNAELTSPMGPHYGSRFYGIRMFIPNQNFTMTGIDD